MPSTCHRRLLAVLCAAPLALPVAAGSLAASSAAGGSSASMGASASSDSSEASSDSSSRRRTAAAGPYRITAVVALADRPGEVQLQLQALDAGAAVPALALVLPASVVARHGLAAGQQVTARAESYGTAFQTGVGGPAFHLVLDAGWQRELDAQLVRL